MCDCIDEMDRRKREPPNPPQRFPRIFRRRSRSIPRRRYPPTSFSALGKRWSPVLGGATLLALIALLYKSRDKVKKLLWTEDFYGPTIKKWKEFLKLFQIQKQESENCICEDLE